MWCFFDESWPRDDGKELMVIAGVLMNDEFLPVLENALYGIKKKYFGIEYAKDPRNELKGNRLLGNHSFELAKRPEIVFVKNHAVVREILGFLIKEHEDKSNHHFARVFASAVFGKKPKLLCPDNKSAPVPYRVLCRNTSMAAEEFDDTRKVTLIYDQRIQAQHDLAITLRGFNAGLKIPCLHPVPYFGVSHASAPLQVADIIVYIIARRLYGDARFQLFYEMVRRLQWTGAQGGRKVYGINSWQETDEGKYYKCNPKEVRAGAPGRGS